MKMNKLWPVHAHDLTNISIQSAGWEYISLRQTSHIDISNDGLYLLSHTINPLSVELWSIISFPALISSFHIADHESNSNINRTCIAAKISAGNNAVAVIYNCVGKDSSLKLDYVCELYIWNTKSTILLSSMR